MIRSMEGWFRFISSYPVEETNRALRKKGFLDVIRDLA